MTQLEALEEAVHRAKGQAALARLLGAPVSQAHVWQWLNRSEKAPGGQVLAIERVTGVSRHDLRPDLYPRETAPAPATAAKAEGQAA